MPLEESIDEVYSKIRVSLESNELPMNQHDLLVAAHALSLGLAVVSVNDREFSYVENLKVENWLNE